MDADEKKKCGVILTLDYSGKLSADTGFIKPGTKGVFPSAQAVIAILHPQHDGAVC